MGLLTVEKVDHAVIPLMVNGLPFKFLSSTSSAQMNFTVYRNYIFITNFIIPRMTFFVGERQAKFFSPYIIDLLP